MESETDEQFLRVVKQALEKSRAQPEPPANTHPFDLDGVLRDLPEWFPDKFRQEFARARSHLLYELPSEIVESLVNDEIKGREARSEKEVYLEERPNPPIR